MTPPDSDAREVRGAQMDAPSGPICWCGKPSRHESGWCGRCNVLEDPPPSDEVSLPLSLAQRILAALDAAASDYERLKVYGATPIRALTCELRERLPR